jgi:drug/metabolite transporter (DMT)-like permease
MPLWIILSFLAGAVGSLANILYRTTLKDGQDALISTWMLQVSRLVFATAFVVWFGVSFTTRSIALLAMLGCIEVVGMYAYMRMHAASALSISTIVQRSRILWTAILAAVFVGETFTFIEVCGLLILFIGVSVVAAPHLLRTDKGMQFAYVSAVIFSITTIMIKATIGSIPPAAQVVGLAFPSVIIFPILTRGFGNRLKRFTQNRFFLKLSAALANVIQLFLIVYAIALGPAARASAVDQGTLVLSVLVGIILLGERTDVPRKLLGSFFVLLGIAAVSW